jgi:hypothetical protein
MSAPLGGPTVAESLADSKNGAASSSASPRQSHGEVNVFGKSGERTKTDQSVLGSTDGARDAEDDHAEVGVSKVEAFNKVLYQSGRSGKVLLWLLAISVYLTMFAYALGKSDFFGRISGDGNANYHRPGHHYHYFHHHGYVHLRTT